MKTRTVSDPEELLAEARNVKDDAYAPYSGFKVGAAIRTADGSVYTGANVEIINLTNTAHAEQNALHQAVIDGHHQFSACAISLSGEPKPPCGLCRQSLSEFCKDSFPIVVEGLGEFTLGELLPASMETIDDN